MTDSLRIRFPSFGDQIASGLGDPIEEARPPAADDEIRGLEARLSIPLPESYKGFLRCTRAISLRGGTIRFGPTFPFFHDFPPLDPLTPLRQQAISQSGSLWPPPSQGMLCFADFFWEADGDQVLFNIQAGLVAGEYLVMYYAHEDHPLSVRKIADSFSQFLGDRFSYFKNSVGA